MSRNWTSRLVRRLTRLRVAAPEFIDRDLNRDRDRDAERVRRELDLIRIRFAHHG